MMMVGPLTKSLLKIMVNKKTMMLMLKLISCLVNADMVLNLLLLTTIIATIMAAIAIVVLINICLEESRRIYIYLLVLSEVLVFFCVLRSLAESKFPEKSSKY